MLPLAAVPVAKLSPCSGRLIADPVQAVHGGGGFDAFVTKLNHDGSALAYSTYLGGSSFDEGRGIAVHPLGTAYVTGFTGSTNFPTANALQSTRTGAGDAFVAKIRPSPCNEIGRANA